MAEYEEKFIVFHTKVFNKLYKTNAGRKAISALLRVCKNIANLYEKQTGKDITLNEYYVCNKDEPYADEVLKLILEGEDAKKRHADSD